MLLCLGQAHKQKTNRDLDLELRRKHRVSTTASVGTIRPRAPYEADDFDDFDKAD